MHRCLRIDEIVRFIASCLDDEQHRRSNLAHMALTCHAFYGPATTKLWSRLDGLKPLIQCLPADAIEVEDEHDREPGAIVSAHVMIHDVSNAIHFRRKLSDCRSAKNGHGSNSSHVL